MTSAASSSVCAISFFADELFGARQFRSRVVERHAKPFEIGFGANQVCARLFNLRLDERRIQTREHLSFADQRVEVGVQLLNGSRHLRADLHRGDGLQGAGGAHRLREIAARDDARW